MFARLSARWIPGLVVMACFLTALLRADLAWIELTKLSAPPSDPNTESDFGTSVAIDGELLAVGSPAYTNNYGMDLVFTYRRIGPAWESLETIDPYGLREGLGAHSALDGPHLLISGLDSDQVTTQAFEIDGAQWVEMPFAPRDPNSPIVESYSPKSVAVANGIAVIGDRNAAVGSARPTVGAALVYVNDDGIWTPVADLVSPEPGGASVEFGSSVAIDGDTIVVGDYREDGPHSDRTGAAHVFNQAGGAWSHVATLTASDAAYGDYFANVVAVSGNRIAVGAPYDINEQGIEAGAVYIFEFDGAAWVDTAKIVPNALTHLDHFGWSVALDGDELVAGAPHYSDAFFERGVAFAFHKSAAGWEREIKFQSADPTDYDHFGTSVDISGPYVVIGSPSVRIAWLPPDRRGAFVYVRGDDCNGNGEIDTLEIAADPTIDCDGNGVPDACDLDPNDPDGDMLVADDCNGNGVIDSCDIDPNDPDGDAIVIPDCNTNGAPDDCDISSGDSDDFNGNDIPDECECLGDLSGDGLVGLDDLAQLLADFDCALGPACLGDVDGDGDTDLGDLALLLANFDRTCP